MRHWEKERSLCSVVWELEEPVLMGAPHSENIPVIFLLRVSDVETKGMNRVAELARVNVPGWDS